MGGLCPLRKYIFPSFRNQLVNSRESGEFIFQEEVRVSEIRASHLQW
jgi:hypothetical protein